MHRRIWQRNGRKSEIDIPIKIKPVIRLRLETPVFLVRESEAKLIDDTDTEPDPDIVAPAGVPGQANSKAKASKIAQPKVRQKGELCSPLGDRKMRDKLDTSQRFNDRSAETEHSRFTRRKTELLRPHPMC
jgi:hypothetical protein